MRTIFLVLITAVPALAESFDRPVPNAQSATAEIWFGLASILFVVALYVVHRVVSRR